jgi:hypothetical protein
LREDFLGTKGELFRFDDAKNLAAHTERVIGRATLRWKFLNRTFIVCAERPVRLECDDAPASGAEFGIYDLLSHQIF